MITSRLVHGFWITALLCSFLPGKSATNGSEGSGKQIAYWKFDEVRDDRTKDEATGMMDFIEGRYNNQDPFSGR